MTNAKAGVAVVIALGVAITAALQGDNTIGVQDGIVIALAVLGSGALTWWLDKSQAAKAFAGGLGASLTALGVAISDDQIVTHAEWATAVVGGLIAFSGVFWTPNEIPPPDEGNPPSP